jgi:hypothetical protein
LPQTSLRGRDCGPFTKSDDAGHRTIASQVPQLQRGLHPDFPTIGQDRNAGSARTRGEPWLSCDDLSRNGEALGGGDASGPQYSQR